MANRLSLILTSIALFGLTACGGIQRARFYVPTDTNPESISKEWADGLATADPEVCVWIASHTLDSYDVMWAGPIFLPFFPVGAAAEAIEGERDPTDIIFTWLSIFPGPNSPSDFVWNLDPANVVMTFENGESKSASTVEIVKFSSDPNGGKSVRNKASAREPLAYFQAPESYSGWNDFILRFKSA